MLQTVVAQGEKFFSETEIIKSEKAHLSQNITFFFFFSLWFYSFHNLVNHSIITYTECKLSVWGLVQRGWRQFDEIGVTPSDQIFF